MKTISINGADFALKRKVIKLEEVKKRDFRDLEQCYTKCSTSKVIIFNYWKDILKDIIILNYYGVRSYNANMITLHALITLDNKSYYVDITKSHNNIYEVID